MKKRKIMGKIRLKSGIMQNLRDKYKKALSDAMKNKIKKSSDRSLGSRDKVIKTIANEITSKSSRKIKSAEDIRQIAEKKWGWRRSEIRRFKKVGLTNDEDTAEKQMAAEEERLAVIKRRNLNWSRYNRDRNNSSEAENLLGKRVKTGAGRKVSRTEAAAERVETINKETGEGGAAVKTKITADEIGVHAQEGAVSILGNKQAGELGGTQAAKGGSPVASQSDARSVAGSFNPETKLTGNFPGAGGAGGGGASKALPGGGGISRNVGSRPSIPLRKI